MESKVAITEKVWVFNSRPPPLHGLCIKTGCCSGFATSLGSAGEECFRVAKDKTTKNSNNIVKLN